jgi:hypothetical protein
MLEQFIKSIVAHFVELEPMNAYVQSMPENVKYPCYLVNKVDINTRALNSYYFVNTITPYIRVFGENEVDLKNKVTNLIQKVFEDHTKIPIRNEDGTKSKRFIRVEQIEAIDITVDQNEVYCKEINFNFETTHTVNAGDFETLRNFSMESQ